MDLYNLDSSETGASSDIDAFWFNKNGTKEDIDLLADFEKGAYIGRGSFGEVHRYKHRKKHVIVAVKCFRYPNINEKPQQKERHEIREHDFFSKIQGESTCCPNIVFYHGFIASPRMHRIFMELMDCNFQQLLEDNKKDWVFCGEMCWALLKQTANGLRYIHERGYMHRDVKPSNILFSYKDGFAKLADFGTCKEHHQKEGQKLHSRGPGTPCYTAPEVLLADESVPHQSKYNRSCDIWSLAISAVELVTGDHPISKHKGFTGSLSKSTNADLWFIEELITNINELEIIDKTELDVSQELFDLLQECFKYKELPPVAANIRPSAQRIYDRARVIYPVDGSERAVMRKWCDDNSFRLAVTVSDSL